MARTHWKWGYGKVMGILESVKVCVRKCWGGRGRVVMSDWCGGRVFFGAEVEGYVCGCIIKTYLSW